MKSCQTIIDAYCILINTSAFYNDLVAADFLYIFFFFLKKRQKKENAFLYTIQLLFIYLKRTR
jgi:hypothetical protein